MAGWSVPARLDAWYLAASPGDVARGRIATVDLLGERVVIGRTAAGLAALAARCPHMGADLGAGVIHEGRFVCPLHGLAFDGSGRCARPDIPAARSFPVAESQGGIWVHPGAPRGPVPTAARWDDLAWAPAWTERVPVSLGAVLVNAFDLHHLRVVHRRELVGEPAFTEGPGWLRLVYATRVAGDGPTDRLTRALSGEALSIWLTCVGGTTLVVEVDLGRTRTAAVVGLVPDGDWTWFRIAVGVPAGPGAGARAWLARGLYVSFLRRDLPVLRGATLAPRSSLPEDAPVQRLLGFVDGLPQILDGDPVPGRPDWGGAR